MDRREAIPKLELMRCNSKWSKDFTEALDLAIDALNETMSACYLAYKGVREQLQLSGETSTVSEKESVEGVAESATTTDCNYTCSDCKHQDKTYEQEPCHSCFNNDGAGYEPDTDCISRQQAIEVIEGVDWYRVNSKGELVHGSTSDEESWYRAEDIYKAIESLPPVTHDKRTETHGVCLDTISRQKANDKLKRLVNEMEGIFANIRMRNVDDSVCGLCEYDADHGLDGYANECPGFETDDCFKLNEKYRREWLDIEQ